MLTELIDWSLRNRLLVLAGGVGLVVVGLISLSALNIDIFPDTTPVQVQINAVAPGLAPQEVESQITAPIEQGISGLPKLEQVRSLSKYGLSQVVVTFADGSDIYFARQQITERLGSVVLPVGMPRPTLGPVATGMGEVFHYLVTKDNSDLTELRTLQDWTIRPALRTVPGTAEINSWGGLQKQYQVLIDPQRLLKYDLNFDQVSAALRDNNLTVGGGALEQSGQMLLVRGTGRTTNVAQIGAVPVTTRQGVPVHVSDVAEVRTGAAQRMGGVTADGKGEVVLGLGFLLIHENGRDVTRGLSQKLADVGSMLPWSVRATPVYARTDLVDRVIE